ncbi:hypothetical protein BC829DRAFT_427642 [Chytridium lagenaria]|nr:hypothetical protein BC829DRAFT_427642 [Chytridium lagenaria]
MSSNATHSDALSGPSQLTVSSYLCLIAFVLAVIPVLAPFRIPIHRRRKLFVDLNLVTSPIIAIIFLLCTRAIEPHVVLTGLAGTQQLQPYSILILFYSIAYICISLDITGFLKNGRKTFLYFFILTLVGSGLTSNDAVILTATAFLAFLMSEFVSANIASMALYIGNPTNVVVAQANGIGFAEYSAWMIIPTIACAVLAYVMLRYVFVFHVPVWMVTLPFAGVAIVRDIWYDMYIRRDVAIRLPTITEAFGRLPWPILPFSLCMFILVESLSFTGWISILASVLAKLSPSFVPSIFSTGIITVILCSLLNNLPATILLTRVLLHPNYLSAIGSSSTPQSNAVRVGAIYALVAGSNVGAILTICGSLAGIMWEKIVRDMGVKGLEPLRFFILNLALQPVLIVGACAVICVEVYVVYLRGM